MENQESKLVEMDEKELAILKSSMKFYKYVFLVLFFATIFLFIYLFKKKEVDDFTGLYFVEAGIFLMYLWVELPMILDIRNKQKCVGEGDVVFSWKRTSRYGNDLGGRVNIKFEKIYSFEMDTDQFNGVKDGDRIRLEFAKNSRTIFQISHLKKN